ncbi:hypothetical protein [Magnetovibrio sp.]|uniref:hypothetical protein n=1 Tax=Magnetovibrio sp. TaxID=2024836 RepID=UPI002F947CA8
MARLFRVWCARLQIASFTPCRRRKDGVEWIYRKWKLREVQGTKAMRLIFPLSIAGALAVVAWPLVDTTDDPAMSFIDARTTNFPVQRAAWVGDDEKRNAILSSAVWVAHESAPPLMVRTSMADKRNFLP